MLGREIGGYKILRILGRGGMGTVYHAVQAKLGREVALKVLQLGRRAHEVDERLVKRFEREVASACRLRHPNLVPIFDSGQEEDFLYYAMELVGEGEDLDQLVEGGRGQSPDFVLTLLEQMAAAFEHVHAQGLVHRDIKPSNILVTEGPVFRLMDFGLVMDIERTRLTATGKRIGTPRYMSPEMLVGHPVDGRSDIYQLAVVAYELLTGKAVFDGKDIAAIGRQCMSYEPPRVDSVIPEVSPELGEILYRAMAKHPDDRFQDATQLVRAIVWAREGQAAHRADHSAGKVRPSASRSAKRRPVRRGPKTLAEEVDAFLMADRDSKRLEAVAESTPAAPADATGGRRFLDGLRSARMILSLGLWGLLTVAVLAMVVRSLFPGPPPYGARELEVLRGLTAAVGRWKSDRPYTSQLQVSKDREEERLERIVREEAPPTTTHRVYVSGLVQGEAYRVRVRYPDGRESLPLRFRMPPRGERLLERCEVRRDGMSSGRIEVRTRIPVEASLTFRRGGRGERLESSGWKDRHDFALDRLDEAVPIRDLRLTLVGIDSLERHWLGRVPGLEEWIRSFVEEVKRFEFDGLRQVAGEGKELAGFAAARRFAEIRPALERVFREDGGGLPSALLMELYGALERYEEVDAAAEGAGRPAPFEVADLCAPWVERRCGGLPDEVLLRVPFSRLALAAFEARGVEAGGLMSVVAHNRAPKTHEERVAVPRGVTRPWIGFQVEGFNARRMLRVWVDGRGPFRLRGQRNERPWAFLRLPEGLLRPGRRSVRVSARCIGEEAWAVIEARELVISQEEPR